MSKYLVALVTPRGSLDFFADYPIQLRFASAAGAWHPGPHLGTVTRYWCFGYVPKKSPPSLTDSTGSTFTVPVVIHLSLVSPARWLRGLQG